MHTPDGFLTSWVCVACILFALLAVGYAVFSARRWMTRQKAVMMAGLSAVIFGFQMLNFPIGNGTSGHLIGAAIAAILLGPQAAILILSSVLAVQALVYGDGGILALGANILIMGIIGSYTAHYAYRSLKQRFPVFSGVFASWASVVAASAACALLLGISGTIAFAKVIPAMLLTHVFIGLGEGLITGSILLYINSTKQELLDKDVAKKHISKKHDAIGLARYAIISTLGAVLIISLALPFASSSPDGLEKVALRLGFFENAVEIYSLSPMPDYTLFGQESYLFVLLAGLVGMAAVFGLSYAIARPLAGGQRA